MTTFTLNFLNNSDTPGSFCICQHNPSLLNPSTFPLAWLVKSGNPQTKVPISWNTDFYFFWAKTGELAPGVIFNAGEAFLTSFTENNAVTLTKRDGNYKFINQRDWYQPGVLNVTTDTSTAFKQASIGIGMSGSGTVAVQAQPNMSFSFSPMPQNWVIFGDFQQGQVLDPSKINNAVQILFPYGIFSMNVTLNMDNSWTITQGAD